MGRRFGQSAIREQSFDVDKFHGVKSGLLSVLGMIEITEVVNILVDLAW
jgi:hypothetical protein